MERARPSRGFHVHMWRIVVHFLVASSIVVLLNAQRAPGHPPFLEGAPVDVINNFHDLILANAQLTDVEMRREVEVWVKKQSPAIQAKFAEFEMNIAKAIQQHHIAHQKAIARYSPAAKAADARLHAFIEDPHLSVKEKHEKASAFYDSLPSKVQEEIEQAMRGGH